MPHTKQYAEHQLRVLEEENQRLSDRISDLMLFGLVAEGIEQIQNAETVVQVAFERICILLNLKEALWVISQENGWFVRSSYHAHSSESLQGRVLPLEALDAAGVQKYPCKCVKGHMEYLVFIGSDESLDENRIEILKRVAQLVVLRVENIGFNMQLEESRTLLEEMVQQRTLQIEKEVKQKQELISVLERTVDEMSAIHHSLAHDLRSPLVTIRGFIAEIKTELDQGNYDCISQYFQYIESAASHMSEMLVDLTRLNSAGRMIHVSQNVNVNEVFKNVLTDMHYELELCKAEIQCVENLPVARADSNRVRQILQNLVENSMKYRHPSRTLQMVLEGVVELECNHYIFRDNGIGIPKEYHEKVFGLFEKLSKSTPGTGIGLALVRRMLNFMGGTVWIQSEGENSGIEVHFTLPKALD